jgi:hypothetical protein
MLVGRRSSALRAIAALGFASSLGLAAPSWAADPPTLRLGYGSAAEEQLYLLMAKPEMGKN